LDDAYLSLPNMRYANVVDHLHRIQAKRQHAELPVGLTDRILGSDKAL
jgi:hypothetical protein